MNELAEMINEMNTSKIVELLERLSHAINGIIGCTIVIMVCIIALIIITFLKGE